MADENKMKITILGKDLKIVGYPDKVEVIETGKTEVVFSTMGLKKALLETLLLMDHNQIQMEFTSPEEKAQIQKQLALFMGKLFS